MQLVLLLAALTTLFVADAAPHEPAGAALWRLAAALVGVAAVTGIAAVGARRTAVHLRVARADPADCLAVFERYRRVHLLLWGVVAASIVFGLRWAQIVRYDWGLRRTILLDEVLLLVPILLPIVLAWAAYYDVDQAMRFPSGQPATGRRPASRFSFVALQVRHQIALWLFPLLLLLSVQDTVRLVRPDWLAPQRIAGVFAAPLALVLLFFPQALRVIWRAKPLPAGPLRERLLQAARAWRFRARDILVWHTDGMVAGAALAGMLPRWRYVFLSDRLLEHLSDDEVMAVFAHEVGHVRHRHLFMRLGLIAAPIGLWEIVRVYAPISLERAETVLQSAAGFAAAPLVVAMVTMGAVALYMVLFFGFWSRRLESQADWFACQATPAAKRSARVKGLGFLRTADRDEAVRSQTEVFAAALEKLARLNGTRRTAAGWQHASIAKRVELVRRAVNDPRFARRLSLEIHLLAASLLALFLAAGVGFLVVG